MKCDHCRKAATEHVTEVVRGVRVERNLCAACAAALATADTAGFQHTLDAAKAWHAARRRTSPAGHDEQACAGCGGNAAVSITEARDGRATATRYCVPCFAKARADGWPEGEVDLERLMQAFARFEKATQGREATEVELIAIVRSAIRM